MELFQDAGASQDDEAHLQAHAAGQGPAQWRAGLEHLPGPLDLGLHELLPQGIHAALGDLPFGDAEFEGVVLDNVLEHLSEPKPVLAEIRRVLSVSGTLIVGVPRRRGYASDQDHKIFYDGDALVATLGEAGFAVSKLLHMPMKSAWMDQNMPQFCIYGVFTRD